MAVAILTTAILSVVALVSQMVSYKKATNN